jgi:hypothetical protein
MSQEHQKQISKYFDNKPILYIAGLAIVLESPTAAILLGHLLYWNSHTRRPDGFMYKTEAELFSETGLTRTMEETARRKLLKLELIEYKRAGIPAKKCYRVNFVNVQKLLPSLKKTYNLTYPNPPVILDDNLQPITKSTSETTPKITAEMSSPDGRDTRKARRSFKNYRNNGPESLGNILGKRHFNKDDLTDGL